MDDLTHKDYLGDGVYCGFDGYHIWIWASHEPYHKIALEPPVLEALNRYSNRLKEPTNAQT